MKANLYSYPFKTSPGFIFIAIHVITLQILKLCFGYLH
jgi:hypothetical protein